VINDRNVILTSTSAVMALDDISAPSLMLIFTLIEVVRRCRFIIKLSKSFTLLVIKRLQF